MQNSIVYISFPRLAGTLLSAYNTHSAPLPENNLFYTANDNKDPESLRGRNIGTHILNFTKSQKSMYYKMSRLSATPVIGVSPLLLNREFAKVCPRVEATHLRGREAARGDNP